MSYKAVILVTLSYFLVQSDSADVPTEYSTDLYSRSYDPSLANAVQSDVQYRLFSTAEDEVGTIYTTDTVSNASEIDRSLDTKFIIHGWTTDENSVWYRPLRDAYLESTKDKDSGYNIIFIDWSKAGNLSYPVSTANVVPVGKYIAEFILSAKFDLEKVHVIGHSLGSHVAAFVGKYVFKLTNSERKIGRITATDPAGPFFEIVGEDLRLSRNDADFVDVIHTDVGHYGFNAAIGHVDYYPNGGHTMPGCPPLEEDDNCSHAKSNIYFIASISARKDICREAISWEEYLDGNYLSDVKLPFGQHCPHSARGTYFCTINL